MSNATTATAPVEAEVTSAFSDKTIDYLIRTAAEGSTSPEETYRKLIELTVEATQRKRKRPKHTELANNFAIHERALIARLQEYREVTFNTLQKMTGPIPTEFDWARGRYATLRITGIYRAGGGFGSAPADITSAIASGKTGASEYDTLHFEATPHGTGKPIKAQVPLYLLNGDPIAQAKRTRNICKAHRRQVELTEAKELANKKTALKSQLTKLNNELAALEQKEAKKTAKAVAA